MWGTADARVTRAETDAVFAALCGPKQQQDFAGADHEPYWRKNPRLWKRTVAAWCQQLAPEASGPASTTQYASSPR